MSNETLTPWLTVKTGMAGKLGRNGGEVGFRVLRDPDGLRLALAVTSNSGGGCWSPEVVDLDAIECSLPDDRQEAVTAATVARAFTGRSVNQGPFAMAVLLALGFMVRATEHPNRYQIADRWAEIKAGLLTEEAGEAYVPPVKGRQPGKTSGDAVSAMTQQDIPGEVETDYSWVPLKGRKGRLPKHAEPGHDHAALGQ